MANDHKLLSRCVAKLDSMSHGLTECRPKTLEKLKNTLKKESEVIFVNQILIYLLTTDSAVPLKNEEVVHKTDSDLDIAIAEAAFKRAQDEGRHFFVLPCDSDLHIEIESKVHDWYSQKLRMIDTENPAFAIASACSVDSHLDVDKITRHLEHLDIMHQWLELVSYKFPDTVSLNELSNAWEKWIEEIKANLGKASACTYHLFSSFIKQANDSIQNARIEAIGAYCEDMYINKYPAYKSYPKNQPKIEKMETSNDCGNQNHQEEPADVEERKQSLLNSPLFLWPVGIEPEVVHVILKLWATEKKPETLHQFKTFVKSVGHITYVASPRYVLMSKISKENKIDEGDEITLNVRLGSSISVKTFQLNNTSALGSVLIYPGKRKPAKGKSFQRIRSMFDRMDTSSDTSRETLRGFQEYILKTVKQLSQRTGAIMLFDDAEANERCRDNLRKYLSSLTECNGVSGNEFSNEMMKLACEQTTVPIENLINLLLKAGYLQINEVDQSVTYTPGYRRNKFIDKAGAEATFLRGWEAFYKQTEEPSDIEMGSYTRKRKFQMPLFTLKRQRLIDI
ncbi:uncharacterized protein LOC132742798 [Ruditapes philippinarum]|uniref:uncharacterized protein LOC132742798 n=1 Tax=Ruditapes philippinarum TaxID=129788 RepID=UPI00295B20AF|nr:uncharacterized protein LOC132742798 [Ruditapes philippinarum]